MLNLYQLLLNLCQNGRVPLHYAADGGRIETIRALVTEFNCPPDCRDDVSDLHSPNYGPAWLDTVHCAALMVHYETAVYCRYFAAGKVVHVCIFHCLLYATANSSALEDVQWLLLMSSPHMSMYVYLV